MEKISNEEQISTTEEKEVAALNPLQSKTLTNVENTTEVVKAAMKEQSRGVQIVDSETRPEDIKELAEGKPVPIILSKEERPVDDVFQNVVNFRDVGGYVNRDSGQDYFKPLNLFRSGRLDDVCTADLELMTIKYNIRCVVDLRSETEGRMGEDLVNTFPAAAIIEQLKLKPSLEKEKEHDLEDEADAPIKKQINHKHSQVRTTYFINFAGRRFRYYGVWKPLSLRQKGEVLFMMGTGRKAEAIAYVGECVIQPRGLFGLNQNFVDYCGDEIMQAIKIMAKKDRFPMLVHCTQGKDRTGLVIALALSICGVDRKYIIMDYGRTQAGLARQRDVMVEEMRKTGLDSSFSDAPVEVMEKTLDYINEKYGGAISYLKKHGLTNDMIDEIRENLLNY